MYHLIKKDFLVQKRNLKISLLIMLFFTLTFANVGTAGFAISVIAITYMLMQGAFAMDDKNNCDRMLISLPIQKNKIVLAKYVSIFVYAFYAIIVNLIIYAVFNIISVPIQGLVFSIESVYGAICGIMLYTSFSFPLLFKLGYHQAKMANFIVFFAAIFGSTYFIDMIMTQQTNFSQQIFQFFTSMSNLEVISITLLPIIIIFILSYFISLNFYRKREY